MYFEDYNYIEMENSRLLTLVIQYPYFEDYEYTKKYDLRIAKTSDGIKYDAYATMVFNLIQHLYCEENGDEKEVLNRLYIPEYVLMHKAWWELNREIYEDIEGNQDFINFIDKIANSGKTFNWMY